jgi:hypothetical protein
VTSDECAVPGKDWLNGSLDGGALNIVVMITVKHDSHGRGKKLKPENKIIILPAQIHVSSGN